MTAIVEDRLTLARQGDIINETEPISLTDIVGKCWGTVDTEDATIELVDETTFQGVPDRLRHVFENLFGNAVEYGGPDSPYRMSQINATDAGARFEFENTKQEEFA